jgi:hypothetical protein
MKKSQRSKRASEAQIRIWPMTDGIQTPRHGIRQRRINGLTTDEQQ